jgi:hypothetical protein
MINKNLITIIMSLALLGAQASDLSPLSAEYAGPTKLACICRRSDTSSPLESENSENPFLNLLTMPAMEGILNKCIGCSVQELLKYYIEDHIQKFISSQRYDEIECNLNNIYWREVMSHIVFKSQSKKELDYKTLLELELRFIGCNDEYIENALQILENSDGDFKECIDNRGKSSLLVRQGEVVYQEWDTIQKESSDILQNIEEFPMNWTLKYNVWSDEVHHNIYRTIKIWNCGRYIVVSFLHSQFSGADIILSPSEVQHLSDCVQKVFVAQEISSTLNREPASSSTDSPNC